MRAVDQGPGRFEKRKDFTEPGQDLVMAGFVSFAETCRIGARRRGELETHFSPMFLNHLDQAREGCMGRWMKRGLSQKGRVVATHGYVREDGILAAPRNLSGVLNVGIDADLRALSIRQIAAEACGLYELSPYGLLYGDCVITTSDREGQLVRRLETAGTLGTVIGCVARDVAGQTHHGEETVDYLKRPRPGELLEIANSYAVQH